jgi:apolipoprotein D and lipocalin family protein
MRLLLISTALTLLGGFLSGCSTLPPPKTVPFVDLNRYMGKWHVIANIPYFLERGKVASYDTYGVRPDGRMQNDFTFRRGSLDAPEETWRGVAWVVDKATNAEWSVQFIWPITATYLVIDLDPDYRWAVIGHPSRKLLWVLGRDTTLSDETYAGILRRAAAQGYDAATITKVPQRP